MYACLYQPPPHSNALRPRPLLAIAQAFSPRYERLGDDLVSIDVSGLGRLLGDAHTIGEALRREAATRGLRVHVALAGTRVAALVLAVACPGLTIVAPGDEPSALAPFPIGILETIGPAVTRRRPSSERESLRSSARSFARGGGAPRALKNDDGQIGILRRWGLNTLGDLAALPPADLAARLGPRGLVWQAVARGEDVRPLVPDVPEERFEASMELEWPIDRLEPLSFVLTRLIEPLSTRLERRDRGAAVLHVLLGLTTRDTCTRSLQLPVPLRDVQTLRTLALLDLESHPPAAPIDRVTIVIDPTPGRVLQHTLFTRAHPTPEQLSTLLARLGALMGHDRIGTPVVLDSYRPGAFAMAPLAPDLYSRGAPPPRLMPSRRSARSSPEQNVTAPPGRRSLGRAGPSVPTRTALRVRGPDVADRAADFRRSTHARCRPRWHADRMGRRAQRRRL